MNAETIEHVTCKVREFYENNPYPNLGHKLSLDGMRRILERIEGGGRLLEAGCGTGFGVVALAKLRAQMRCHGLDLSQPSLDIAAKLAEQHGVTVDFRQGNYLEPLPWPEKFDYIMLFGTLHHCADPPAALTNLAGHLTDDGLIYINLYGKKYHRRRFEIIELLDLLQQGREDWEERFALYQAMIGKQQEKGLIDRLMDLSPRRIKQALGKIYRRVASRFGEGGNPVPWDARFDRLNQLWIDQYCNPNEKTYDIWETQELVEAAGMRVVEMLSLGRLDYELLPASWRPLVEKLGQYEQYRVMELFLPETGSVGAFLKKAERIC